MKLRQLFTAALVMQAAMQAGATADPTAMTGGLPTQAGEEAVIIETGPDTTFPITLKADESAVITAYARGEQTNGDFRSHLEIQIQLDGTVASMGMSYVPVDWVISHHVNATAILKGAGTHQVRLLATGEGIASPIRVKYNYTVFRKRL
jgi:hypothetical protein